MPTPKELPFVFRHQYGTLTIYAKDCDEAVKHAIFISRGMPVTPEFTHPPLTQEGQ